MGNKWNKYLEHPVYNNLAEMLLGTIKKQQDKIAAQWFNDQNEVESISYNELGEIMRYCFGALKKLGLNNGDHIAICSETRVEWIYADFGIQALGGASIAVYPNLKPAEIRYILNDSGSKAIFVDEEERLKKILSIESECDAMKYIIVFDKYDKEFDNDNIFHLKEFLEMGKEFYNKNPESFNESVSSIKDDQLASLIYTSGTTGIPKGTMLTHRNFLSDALAAVSVASTLRAHENPSEMEFLCVLPYSHSFARCVDEYCAIYIGATINFAGHLDPVSIRRAFEVLRPTFMIGVPYLFQKIYNMVLQTVDALPPSVKKIFESAVNAGVKYMENKRDGKKNSLGIILKYYTLTKLVGRVVKKKLGGRMLLMVSGSAAISPDLVLFFLALGFNLVEGYGLTETSPVTHLLRTAWNSDYHPDIDDKIEVYQKLGSIGPTVAIRDNPYPNPQQKLSDFGELLIKGPMVMKGYWNKPKLTEAAFDEDGWLRTGDLAEIDEDGYVYIKGRAKVVIKLLTAKMISPAVVENMVVPASRLIAQIILVGDDTRKYVTCIIVPYQKPLKKYCDEHGIDYKSWRDIITNPEVQQLLKDEIYSMTEEVADYQRPKKFAISSKNFDVGEGYLTPSFKFKRNKIFKDLQEDIDKMYNSDGEFYIIESRMSDFYDQSMIVS